MRIPMKLTRLSTTLLALGPMMLACNLAGATREASPTPAETPSLAAPTPQLTDTPTAVPVYTWVAGGLSIQVPSGYRLFVEQRPGVDGVVTPMPNGIALASNTSPNFVLSIQVFPLKGQPSLAEFVLEDDDCPLDPAQGLPNLVASEAALEFSDTLCGPYGSSRLYVVRQSAGYRFTIESHTLYPETSASVTELLATLQWTGAGPAIATPPSEGAATSWEQSAAGEAELVTTTQGWALAGGRLLWTANRGETWQDITPPVASEATHLDAFFLDPSVGWVAFLAGPAGAEQRSPIHILHTRDRGATWNATELEPSPSLGVFGAPENLEFVGPFYGWFTVSQTLTMNSSAADLYRTSDGGLTWERSALPFDGDTHFHTASIGWLVGSCCTGAPNQLYRTSDGGLTWEKQAIAPNPVDTGFDYHDYSLPVFADARSGALAITLRDESYETTAVAFYRTQDSGETWQLAATLPRPPGPFLPGPGGSAGISIPAQVLTLDIWFVSMGQSLDRTLDGGATWEEFPQSGLPGFHARLQFVTADFGWSVLFKDNCGSDCELLARTFDGGQTWAPVVFGP